MLRRQKQSIVDEAERNGSTCSSLLSRIRNQHRRDIRKTYIESIRKRCLYLFIYTLILLIFRCPNRVYNAWKGPFPMNLNQFRNHLETNYHRLDYKSYFPFHKFLSQVEYIQIELGANVIDQSTKNTMRIFYGHYSYGQLLYTFHRVREATIDTSDMILYIKFTSDEQSYSQQRYSYHFQSFSIKTLRCILEQLTISSREYLHWPEKSIYIEKIEQIYDQNPIIFNKKVIKKCGILIGYLYRPTNEYVFPGDSYKHYQFSKHVRAFDASSPYTPYISYVLLVLFIYLLFNDVKHLIHDIIYLICSPLPSVHPAVQKQLIESNLNSLENLDHLMLTTTHENNYYNRLFIGRGGYLIMLMIDLQEKDEKILRRFYTDAPLTIIPLQIIGQIRRDCIVLGNNDYGRRIYFPGYSYSSSFDPSHWLHERLMILSSQYRYTWEQEEQLRHDEETRCLQEEEHRRLLQVLVEEEAQYQWRQYENDINRIWQGTTSASPRFIADYRLADRQIVASNLLDQTCSICLDHFQWNQYYTQWPCPAKHTFHFDCMLDVLRAGNTCPLCRSPVEAADLPNTETVLRLIFRSIMPNRFT